MTSGNVTTNANLTGPITSVGNATSIASQTGTGSKFVVDTSPTLITPNLGTPTSGVLTNCTGTASGLTAGNVTTNANLTGDVTSVGNATTLTNAPVIAKVLTGYSSGAGTIASTDSILQAFQKVGGLVDNAVWSTYSPTITCSSGTFTGATISTTGRYKQIGKTIHLQLTIILTALGTGVPAGQLIATLPVNAIASTWQVGNGRENNVGNPTSAFISTGDNTRTSILGSAGGTVITTGNVVITSIVYEAA